MIVSRTAKVGIKAHKALSAAQKSVHGEIDELLRSSNVILPPLELIFCPLVFPEERKSGWKERVRYNRKESWISFEKWLDYEPFVTPAVEARATYANWIKNTLREFEKKYPELAAVRDLFDRLSE
jgi:hypothetical protein